MERNEDLDAYWRRRVFILAGGLAILGLLAWALSGSGGAAPTPAARQAAVAQVRAANGLPAAAYGSMPASPAVTAPSIGSAPATGSPSAAPSASRSARAKAEAKRGSARRGPAGRAKASAAKRPRHVPGAALRPGALCPAGSVVMTVFSAKPSYVPGDRPVFDVYAVSTAPVSCVFRFGPGAVRVLVSQHGRVVWDSAECRPATVQRARLARGVPVQMSVSWNRHAAYGCRGWLSSRASGHFTAVARAGSQSSPSTGFDFVR
jgi:hypothetical protein